MVLRQAQDKLQPNPNLRIVAGEGHAQNSSTFRITKKIPRQARDRIINEVILFLKGVVLRSPHCPRP